MTPWLVRNIVFPLHERFRGRETLGFLGELERTQWLAPEALREVQTRKLQALLRYAVEQVPYYRNLFRSLGAVPDDFRTLDDLARLPLLTKEIIRQNLDDLVAEGEKGTLLRNSTGGSTGTPLVFYAHPRKEALGNTAKLRARRWWGIEIGDRELHLWGNPVELGRAGQLRAAKDRLLNQIVVSAYDLSEEKLERLAGTIRRFRPVFLYVYPSALVSFCRFLRERGIDLAAVAPRYVISTAETLLPAHKAFVEETLGTKVIFEYGSHDGCAVIAHDCPCGRMHTTDELVHLEFIRDGKPVASGETGEIVLTNLESYGMPFIRYATGDLGRRGEPGCANGRGLGSLEALEGRVSENLYRTDGRPMPGLYLTGFMQHVPGVADFQVEQTALRDFTVSIVGGDGYADTAEAFIRAEMEKGLGGGLNISFRYIDVIPRTTSGKKLWVVCSVPPEQRKD
jgi:phenylacetate-CoA ligase